MYQNIKTIKVGTFNLMNFMLPDRELYNGTLSYTQSEYRRKSEWVEFMLNQMHADIIGFQELIHRDAMVRVIKNNPHYHKARLYMAEETGDQPSVALLSRYPVENFEVYTHFPEEAVIDFNPRGRDKIIMPFTTFTRPVIKADIRIKEYGLITVFVVHLKSKRAIFYNGEDPQNPVDLARAQSRSLMLRAAESVALRALVSQALETPDRPVILCGDVNDTGNAVTSRIISGEVPQHRLSDSVKRRVWDLLLYHVKDIQARRSYQDFYYTHIHNGMYESLDHIMVSQELVTEYPRNTGRVGLVSVYNDHLVDQTFSQVGQDKCKSDHGVVVCSLELDLDRAARIIKDYDGEYTPIQRTNPEKALSLLDETDDDEPAPIPLKYMENVKPTEAVNDPSAPQTAIETKSQPAEEGFNVQNSLDKWKRNNPQQGRTDRYHHNDRPQRTVSGSYNTKPSTGGNTDRNRRYDHRHNTNPIVRNLDDAREDIKHVDASPVVETPVIPPISEHAETTVDRRISFDDQKQTVDAQQAIRAEEKREITAEAPKSITPAASNVEESAKPQRRLFRIQRQPIDEAKHSASSAEIRGFVKKSRQEPQKTEAIVSPKTDITDNRDAHGAEMAHEHPTSIADNSCHEKPEQPTNTGMTRAKVEAPVSKTVSETAKEDGKSESTSQKTSTPQEREFRRKSIQTSEPEVKAACSQGDKSVQAASETEAKPEQFSQSKPDTPTRSRTRKQASPKTETGSKDKKHNADNAESADIKAKAPSKPMITQESETPTDAVNSESEKSGTGRTRTRRRAPIAE